MGGPLRGNHLRLALDLAFRRNLEELVGPVLIAEFDALLVVLVIWTGAGAAQPLLVSVPKLLFQCRAAGDCSFLPGFLTRSQRCARQQNRHTQPNNSKRNFHGTLLESRISDTDKHLSGGSSALHFAA